MSLKKPLLIVFCIFSLLAGAQTNTKNNMPRAALAYNAEKSGEHGVNYNTSFFIFDHHVPDSERSEKIRSILKADPSFKKLEILDVNGTKDMMVILDVSTLNSSVLTQKISSLLKELGVYTVEYNGETLTLDKFKF